MDDEDNGRGFRAEGPQEQEQEQVVARLEVVLLYGLVLPVMHLSAATILASF